MRSAVTNAGDRHDPSATWLRLAAVLSLALTVWLAISPSQIHSSSQGVEPALNTPLSRDAARLLAPVMVSGSVAVKRDPSTDRLNVLIIHGDEFNPDERQQIESLLAFGIDFRTGTDTISFEKASTSATVASNWIAFMPALGSGIVFLFIMLAMGTGRRTELADRSQPMMTPSSNDNVEAPDDTNQAVVRIREWMAEDRRE